MPGNEEALAIERMLNGCDFGHTVYHHDLIASTQTEAKRWAQKNAVEGLLVIARVQSAGYGRKGDAWSSGAGGLWFSIVLKPKFSPLDSEKLSVKIGECISTTLTELFPDIVFLVKAPNDILVVNPDGTRKKICGILLEASVTESKYDWMVLGVGLNINNQLPGELKESAVTLEELTGRPIPRMPILKALAHSLAAAYRTLDLD